jgi:hypothetical protein
MKVVEAANATPPELNRTASPRLSAIWSMATMRKESWDNSQRCFWKSEKN